MEAHYSSMRRWLLFLLPLFMLTVSRCAEEVPGILFRREYQDYWCGVQLSKYNSVDFMRCARICADLAGRCLFFRYYEPYRRCFLYSGVNGPSQTCTSAGDNLWWRSWWCNTTCSGKLIWFFCCKRSIFLLNEKALTVITVLLLKLAVLLMCSWWLIIARPIQAASCHI